MSIAEEAATQATAAYADQRRAAALRYRELLSAGDKSQRSIDALLKTARELGRSGEQLKADAALVARLVRLEQLAEQLTARQLERDRVYLELKATQQRASAAREELEARLRAEIAAADRPYRAASAAVAESKTAVGDLRLARDQWVSLVEEVPVDSIRAARRRAALAATGQLGKTPGGPLDPSELGS